MLRAYEYSVGTLADAKAPSLLLPRTKSESAFLIGHTSDGVTAAVVLDGPYRFRSLECAGARNWRGLLIANVYVEADEMSLFDPDREEAPFGTLVRRDTTLTVLTEGSEVFGFQSGVVLEANLAPTRNLRAGFFKWRIMIGEAHDRRVLREIDTRELVERS